MSVWIPLQDTNEANGCLWVVPGSHRRGLMPHHRQKTGQCRLAIEPQVLSEADAIPFAVKAGDVLLFSALLWHHSKGNQTGHVRRAFIVSYQEAMVAGGNGKQWKILRPAG